MNATTRSNGMTHGSLFSGRGGFDVAAETCGICNIWNCELDTWLRYKLKRISPNAKQYSNVKTCVQPDTPTIISAGFPCQDISIASPTNAVGITGRRSGLWSEVKRICSESKPGYVLLENSSELRRKGLEKVLSDLSEIGYDVEWHCLRGCDFGFPVRRERIYIIAYPNSNRFRRIVFRPPGTYELSRTWTPTKAYLSVSASRANGFRNIRTISRGDVVHNYRREIHAFGNAVMPAIAEHLFRCIIDDYNFIKSNGNKSNC